MFLSFLPTGAGFLHSQQATNFIFSSHLLERPHIFYPRSFCGQELTYTLYIACILVDEPRPSLDFFRPHKVHGFLGSKICPFFKSHKKKRWIFRSNLSRPADWKKLIFPFNSSAFTVTMPQCHSMTCSPVHLCGLFMVQSSKSNALKPVKESKYRDGSNGVTNVNITSPDNLQHKVDTFTAVGCSEVGVNSSGCSRKRLIQNFLESNCCHDIGQAQYIIRTLSLILLTSWLPGD